MPILFNAVLIGLVLAFLNAKFETVDRRFEAVTQLFAGVDRRFDSVDRRFDDMREIWRAELRRVEEVLDARLRHLEDRT